ncbi:hypothetical protein PG987_006614 [Apiospora arundinis]
MDFSNRVQCTHCGRIYKTKETLRRHLKSHKLTVFCTICNLGWINDDDLNYHMFLKHNISTPHVCHMPQCWRTPGRGFLSHGDLVGHLQCSHNATVEDNNAEAAKKKLSSTQHNPSEQNQGDSDGQDKMDEDDSSADEQGEGMNDGIKLDSRDDENAALRLQVNDLTQRLEKVREQLEEERDDHVMELAGLHRMYQAKFKKLVKILKARYKVKYCAPKNEQ